jgi:hypothetical protein
MNMAVDAAEASRDAISLSALFEQAMLNAAIVSKRQLRHEYEGPFRPNRGRLNASQ